MRLLSSKNTIKSIFDVKNVVSITFYRRFINVLVICSDFIFQLTSK